MTTIESITNKEALSLKQNPTTELTVIDFWAEWCKNCTVIGKTLEEFTSHYNIVKVDVDRCTEAVASYGIRGIPTLVAIKNGNVLGSITGNQTKGDLQEWLKSVEDKAK